MAKILALTGDRRAGKSTIAKHLIQKYGYTSIHAFQAGKDACRAYLERVTGDPELAWEMVEGNLKDTPSPFLPINPETEEHYDPRYLMETLGQFMGKDMGAEWTLEMEIKRALRENPNAKLLVESVTYERAVLKKHDAVLIKITRPGSQMKGLYTDLAVRRIKADFNFKNVHASPEDMVDAFEDQFRDLLA